MLHLDGRVQELPDARGMFLRALNYFRTDGREDPYQKEQQEERKPGSFQDDSFEQHNHHLEIIIGHGLWTYGDNIPGKGWACQWNNSPETIAKHNEGGKETRPRNTAFYIYVKVN